MTADLEKDSTHCLICNSKVGVSTRNSIRIFNENSVTVSEKPLVDTICAVLETDLSEENVHSLVICKKCYKLFNEIDELESRLAEVKLEIFNNYKKTVKKLSDMQNEEEYNDHDYIENLESQGADLEVRYVEKDDPETQEMEGEEERLEEEEEEEEPSRESEQIIFKLEPIAETSNTEERKRIKRSKIAAKVEATQEQIVTRDGSIYTCLLCTNEEDKAVGDAKSIIAHMKSVHETRLYICDICGDDFKKRNELSLHLDDHVAKEEGDFQCEICNRIFSNLRLFRIHKRIHYPQVKSWPCETCGKRYSSRNLLEEHINTHTGVRPYVCENCGKDFASKYTYKAHVKTHEIRPRPYECSQCSKTFLSQQNLNQHERTHNGVKEYICHQCGKAFGSPHNLEVHNIVHTGYKPYICRMCGKAFARKAEIRDHERTHTGEKPYQCEFCGATFSQRSNLQSHKRATHYNDKRYKCDDCGKGFKRRRLLDYHIKAAHTGERPYKCEICTATFVYPEHFKKHMRIHTGEKPYLCEGHLNDTIVVNQPRLTTEDDQVIAIPDGDVELLMDEAENDQLEETELYVTELKDHVIIQEQNDDQMYNEEDVLNIPAEETVVDEEVGHLVDGEMTFTESEELECKVEDSEQVEEVYNYNETEDGETIVVPSTSEYKEMGDEKNAVRLVQIRFPSSVSGKTRSWLSLVQNT
ncbi:uncharacterized protein LOC143375490 isoform X3 [Andrena cerasifolii]|uniref:uncharacterized protein LOC143375490 isoform X3 n=1 Tax=Andrena cerasifolii TaxID=2819439 RepID=UPI004037E547